MKKLIGFIFILAIFLYSCSEKQSTLDVGTHPEDWNNPQSEIFHAKTVLEAGSESCQDCHGSDYLGGTSGVSCYQCHASYPHPDTFHGNFIKVAPVSWDIRTCRSCHGEDYSGGSYAPSCTTCHSGDDGPETCNTCHGSSTNIAPPQDLSNNTVNTAVGVGAHQIHVATTAVTRVYSCTMCHVEVSEFEDPDHLDGIEHAEVVFGELATDSGELSTDWDRAAATCSEVYCHGSFALGSDGDITGKSDPVVWTETNPDPAACDFCHELPPAGHPQVPDTTPGSCAECHGSVVNSSGVIIGKNLHINGEGNF